MGFLSGLGNLFGIGGGGTEAKNNMKRAQWNPTNINMGGWGQNYVRSSLGKGPDRATSTMPREQEALRQGYYGMIARGMGDMFRPEENVGGYGGISPELFSEFGMSNFDQLPPQFYDQGNFDSLMQGAAQAGNTAFGEYQDLMANGGAANYDNWLNIMREKAAPQENKYLQGGLDKQFLRGILASTAGQYQTEGMMDSLNTADLDRQLQAYGMSQDALNQSLGRATGATQLFSGMEGDATNRGFLLNQLQGTRAADRFARAMNLFGTGQNANQINRQNAAQLMGIGNTGVSAQDQFMLNMLTAQGNMASQRSAANAGAGAMLNNYNMNQQNAWASMLNTATEAAGNVASSMLSDRRLKTDIEKVGEIKGINVYKWKYVWGDEAMGFMADEVPWAIAGQIGEYDVIDLRRVF